MKITVLRKMRYEGTFVYVMHFHYTFQYLFAWNDEVYQDRVEMKPRWLKWLLWKLRIKSLYTRDEVEEAEHIVLSGAMRTIDKLVKKGTKIRQAKKQRDKEIEKIKKEVEARTGKPCEWRALKNTGLKGEPGVKGEFYYQCLTHGVAVKMKDGEKPYHK